MGLSLGKGVGGWKRGEVDSDSFFICHLFAQGCYLFLQIGGT